MKDVETVTAFRTESGEVYLTKTEALFHQRYSEFSEYYAKRPLIGSMKSEVHVDNVYDWIKQNKAMLSDLLEGVL